MIVWDTRQNPPAGFEDAWNARLVRTRLGNFTMSPEYLRWDASLGRHARAALVDQDGRRAALVLRETPAGWVSGWPWRWQAVLEAPPEAPLAPSREDARWLYQRCNELAAGRRLMLHLPVAPDGAAPAVFAGSTLVKDMRVSEDEMFKSLDGNKRRAINKAKKDGYVVVEATTVEQQRVFAEVHQVVDRRHGFDHGPLAANPGPGEAWREWEWPWQTLWVAEREGQVVAGSGFGHLPGGGQMDYRANASTPEALKAGANALLAWEALCRGRALGCTAMNWGGVTTFKRELRGERLDTHVWLGGGAQWFVPNHVQAGVAAARARVAALVKARKAAAAE